MVSKFDGNEEAIELIAGCIVGLVGVNFEDHALIKSHLKDIFDKYEIKTEVVNSHLIDRPKKKCDTQVNLTIDKLVNECYLANKHKISNRGILKNKLVKFIIESCSKAN